MNQPLVTVEWLSQHLHDTDLVILDASPQSNVSGLTSEHENICIPGARFFDLKNDFSDPNSPLPNTIPTPEHFQESCRKIGVDNHHKIVVYDKLGIYTSPRVRWLFRAMGHEDVYVLDGGLPAWVKAGNPVDPISKIIYPVSNFEAIFDPSRLKSMQQLVTNLKTKEFLVFDARSVGRFMGTAPEPREGLTSGHMPYAINIPFESVLEDGYYKPKEEILKLFTKPVIEDQDLIFSCGSGLTACIIELAAELVLENKTSVYDGSWTEWAADPKTPIIVTTKE